MKIKFFYLILTVGVSFFLILTAFTYDEKENNHSKTNAEIIKFSHKTHGEIDCEACHSSVLLSINLKSITFPNHENCSSCHETADDKNCKLCHYENKFENLIKSKTDLIFNHKFHNENAKQKCIDCHSGLNNADYSFQSINAKPKMETCYSCHNQNGTATNTCEACHTSTINLKPQDHKYENFSRLHKFSAKKVSANCIMCHSNQSCDDCHTANRIITETNLQNDFYRSMSPANFVDGLKQQKLTRAHDIDFIFTHGINSKGKESECISCHNTETFCVQCHKGEAKYGISSFAPSSHYKQNFVTIGVGTGGGEHSKIAKRDIESCIACHDVQGNDPACLTCHNDADGIKGTNPKTHFTGFMKSEKGDWHENQNSICFNCHTDANAKPNGIKGLGFCKYCHG